MTSRSDERYRVFALLEAIICRKEYYLPVAKVRRLDFGMKQFPLMHELLVRLLLLCLLTLPLIDMYLNFEEFRLVHTLMFCLWNVVLFLSIQSMVAVAVLISQETFLLSVYFIYRLLYVKAKLTKALQWVKSLDILIEHSHLFVCQKNPLKTHISLLQRHLRELTTLTSSYMQTVEQFKYMPAVAYFLLSGVIEFNLYLVLSRSTKPILRTISIFIGTTMAFLLFVAMALMAQLNASSKHLLPEVNCCLFKVRFQSVTRKLALAETQYLIAANRLSLNLADIFHMTRLQLLLGCFTIVQNVLLIIILNE